METNATRSARTRAGAWRLPCIGLVLLWLAVGQTAAAQENVRTYMPPPIPGSIYTVVHYAGAETPFATMDVQIQWGEWKQSGRFQPPLATNWQNGRSPLGVVVRMRHQQPDSIPLTVRTTGQIALGPIQGDPPPEWTDERYIQVIW